MCDGSAVEIGQSEIALSDGTARHWVLIETGSNQGYIFDTNRLRHVVGASELVHRAGTEWVNDALVGLPGVTPVLSISGVAALLVRDADVGRQIVRAVSERALDEAPGLEVTGVVGVGFDPDLRWRHGGAEGPDVPFTHVEALRSARRELARVRRRRPGPALRDLLLPWSRVATDSGLPCSGWERYGGQLRAASAPTLAKSEAGGAAHLRLAGLLGDRRDLVPPTLDDLRTDGWMAVIHADGNGVGSLFVDFPHLVQLASGELDGLTLGSHIGWLTGFSKELEETTHDAFYAAVRDVVITMGDADRHTVLPIVVGGDDVTVACHARLALPLVRALAKEFETRTRNTAFVSALVEAAEHVAGGRAETPVVAGRGGLTLAAGIAYVKPHHPFSSAYAVAESLTASAKQLNVGTGEPPRGAVDLHFSFESTLRELATTRAVGVVDGVSRFGGPYVLGEEPGGAEDLANLDVTRLLLDRLSSSMAHELRTALDSGVAEFQRRLDLIAHRTDLPGSDRQLLDVVDASGSAHDGPYVRFIDAMLLNGIEGVQP